MERKQINRLFLIFCLTFFVLAGCGRTAEREQAQATPARADEPPILVQPSALPSPTFATTATPTAVSTPAASPEPELLTVPAANLLVNPTCDGTHNLTPPGWIGVPSEEMWWTVSFKESNPSTTDMSCRWAQTSTRNFEFDPSGHNGYLYQVIAAAPELTTLEFSGWWTSNHLIRFAVLVDGAESPDGPWTPVWVAFESTTSTKRNWVEIPLRSVALDQGWPYYRFGLFCSYEGRNSGCKVTLLHFGVR